MDRLLERELDFMRSQVADLERVVKRGGRRRLNPVLRQLRACHAELRVAAATAADTATWCELTHSVTESIALLARALRNPRGLQTIALRLEARELLRQRVPCRLEDSLRHAAAAGTACLEALLADTES